MPQDIVPDAIQELLRAQNITVKAFDIQHGRQFRFGDEAILNSCNSGRIVWQGKSSVTSDRIKELLVQHRSPRDVIRHHVAPAEISNKATNKVYGHDVECREQLELLLRRMKLDPVILQNLVGGGQTIIEKLEGSLDVRYACVLLTPDDQGHPAGKPGPDPTKSKAKCGA